MSDQKPVFFGAMIDVSASMGYQIGHNETDEVGSWMRTVLELIDQIILHDVRVDNRVLFSAFGGASLFPIFDILQTFQAVQAERKNIEHLERTVRDPYHAILETLENNGARRIFSWLDSGKLRDHVNNNFEAYWFLDKMQRDKSIAPYIVEEILPPSCRGMEHHPELNERFVFRLPYVGALLGLAAEKIVQYKVQNEATTDEIRSIHYLIKIEINK